MGHFVARGLTRGGRFASGRANAGAERKVEQDAVASGRANAGRTLCVEVAYRRAREDARTDAPDIHVLALSLGWALAYARATNEGTRALAK